MKNFGKVVIWCGVVSLMFTGCAQKKEPAAKAPPPVKILAKVNGVAITEDDLRVNVMTGHGTAPQREKMQALEDVIRAELLYQEGLKLKLDKDPAYLRDTERLEKQLANKKRSELTRRMYNTQIAARVDVTRQEAQDYYRKNMERIATELHLGMMAFTNREEAEAALKTIRGGKSFNEVAAMKIPASANPNARPSWDMGFVAWNQIPADFLEGVYRLKTGETTDVISSPRTGFYIFTLLETRKVVPAKFETMAGLLMMRLRDKKIAEAYEAYVAKLRQQAKIEVF